MIIFAGIKMIAEIELQLQYMTSEIIDELETWIKERRGLRSQMQSLSEVQLEDLGLLTKEIIIAKQLNELTDNVVMFQLQREKLDAILAWIQVLQQQLQASTGKYI